MRIGREIGAAVAATGVLLGVTTIVAAADISKRGFVWAAEEVVVRESPATTGRELGRVKSGYRLAYDLIKDDGAWYRCYQNGPKTPAGWVEGKSVSSKRPTLAPAANPMSVKDTGLGLRKDQASVAAAFRGFDELVKRYVDGKKQSGDEDYLYALADYGGTYRLVNYKMADVPGDGVTKAHDGRVPAPGYFPDRTAEGRKRAAAKFQEGLR